MRLALLVALALAPLPARALSLGVELAPRWSITSSPTVGLLSDTRVPFSTGFHALAGLSDRLEVHLGWRPLTLDRAHWDGASAALDVDSLIAGATWRHPLLGRLSAVGRLELELAFTEAELRAGGEDLRQDATAFGLHPQVGAELRVAGGRETGFGLTFRGLVGHHFASELDLDRLSAEDPAVRPVDLGATDLSGVTLTFAFAATF